MHAMVPQPAADYSGPSVRIGPVGGQMISVLGQME